MIEITTPLATLGNGRAIELAAVPDLDFDTFARLIVDAVNDGQRVSALFGAAGEASDEDRAAGAGRRTGVTDLYVLLADDRHNRLGVARTSVEGEGFASITPRCPQVHLFEREIAEQFGLLPIGHPWLKPVRYRRSWTGRDAWRRPAGAEILPAVGDFYRVEGEEVHEVAVGPVHAGVIEPGHFRFQCHGETVFHLEIALGYQHRGVEEAMIGGPTPRSMHYAETLAGDTTVAHATAYCQVVEALARCQKSARAQTLRGIALELERLANHIGDLGALANDVGFLPTASYCGRIRGDFLNMSALLCGNRFGRGMVRPGGVGFDVDEQRLEELSRRLDAGARDSAVAINLLWDTPSVMARFQDTGPLPASVAVRLGIVGPAARASGVPRDVRHDQPSSIFRFAHIPVSACESGDVFGRAFVRWLEIQRSIDFIREQIRAVPPAPAADPGTVIPAAVEAGLPPRSPLVPASGTCGVRTPLGPLGPRRLAVALAEGWRGEVCHVAITDGRGRFSRYKVVDPSFHNWTGLAYALRNQEISDFPLCNKSFNLSYCGHDL